MNRFDYNTTPLSTNTPITLYPRSSTPQVFDILWSDPQHNEGCRPNSLRGAGTYFGPDVTNKFLQRYKLQYLVRSHECKPDGHEIMHGGKVTYLPSK